MTVCHANTSETLKRTELWRCEKSYGDMKGERRVQKVSSHQIPIMESSEGIQKVIHSMLQGNVTSHLRRDRMICIYGDALFARKGREQSQHRSITQKMKELTRFVSSAKEIYKCVKSLKAL